jgi:hypothetical protein
VKTNPKGLKVFTNSLFKSSPEPIKEEVNESKIENLK